MCNHCLYCSLSPPSGFTGKVATYRRSRVYRIYSELRPNLSVSKNNHLFQSFGGICFVRRRSCSELAVFSYESTWALMCYHTQCYLLSVSPPVMTWGCQWPWDKHATQCAWRTLASTCATKKFFFGSRPTLSIQRPRIPHSSSFQMYSSNNATLSVLSPSLRPQELQHPPAARLHFYSFLSPLLYLEYIFSWVRQRLAAFVGHWC